MTQAGYAALSQAVASIGHAVETMDDANLVGDLRDDAALLMERFSFALNTLPPNA
jgi:hypothetical protein